MQDCKASQTRKADGRTFSWRLSNDIGPVFSPTILLRSSSVEVSFF